MTHPTVVVLAHLQDVHAGGKCGQVIQHLEAGGHVALLRPHRAALEVHQLESGRTRCTGPLHREGIPGAGRVGAHLEGLGGGTDRLQGADHPEVGLFKDHVAGGAAFEVDDDDLPDMVVAGLDKEDTVGIDVPPGGEIEVFPVVVDDLRAVGEGVGVVASHVIHLDDVHVIRFGDLDAGPGEDTGDHVFDDAAGTIIQGIGVAAPEEVPVLGRVGQDLVVLDGQVGESGIHVVILVDGHGLQVGAVQVGPADMVGGEDHGIDHEFLVGPVAKLEDPHLVAYDLVGHGVVQAPAEVEGIEGVAVGVQGAVEPGLLVVVPAIFEGYRIDEVIEEFDTSCIGFQLGKGCRKGGCGGFVDEDAGILEAIGGEGQIPAGIGQDGGLIVRQAVVGLVGVVGPAGQFDKRLGLQAGAGQEKKTKDVYVFHVA